MAIATNSDGLPSFAELGVDEEFVDVLDQRGIKSPFPIQAASLPDALAGHDICGKAPTGSGKTLAFGLATMHRVGKAEKKAPRALMLAPTRELAIQIHDELAPFSSIRGTRLGVVYGGTSVDQDMRRLNKGIDVLVATPGRLEDLLDRGALTLRDVDLVVIDEADRMADMGFLPVVKRLLDQTDEDRQTLLFSATLDGDIDVLVKRYQYKPRRHEVEEEEFDKGDVAHYFLRTNRPNRVVDTANVLAGYESAVVFCRTRRGTDRLAKQLTREGISAEAIHGDRSQNQRERALKRFTDGKCRVLCATDVAARGIHIDDVECVVHYDPPGTDKDYIHRSGRTGRAGRDGVVISMVVSEQEKPVRDLQRQLDLPKGFDDIEVITGDRDFKPKPRDKAPERDQPGQNKKQGQGQKQNRGKSQGQGQKQNRGKSQGKSQQQGQGQGPGQKQNRGQKQGEDSRRSKDEGRSRDNGNRRDNEDRPTTRPMSRAQREEQSADAKAGRYVDVDPRKKKRTWDRGEEGETADGEGRPRRRRNHKPKPGPKGRRKPASRQSGSEASSAKPKKARTSSGKKKEAKRKAASAKANPMRRRKRS